MSTFLELVRIAQRDCGISGGVIPSVLNQSGLFSDLINWVADADYEIQALHGDWDFLWAEFATTTIASTSLYAKPGDWGAWDVESFMLDYSLATHKYLMEMDYKNWRRNYRNGVQVEGKPSYFIVRPDNSIILHNVPDDAYSLTGEYWTRPTRMTANTDTSPIPETFERAIIARTMMKYAEDQGVQSMMNNAQAEFGEWVTRLEADQLPGQNHRRMIESPLNDSVVVIVP